MVSSEDYLDSLLKQAQQEVDPNSAISRVSELTRQAELEEKEKEENVVEEIVAEEPEAEEMTVDDVSISDPFSEECRL